ncbi:MAG TPA: hypothetical protein PL088_16560 [Spirochaetota bacterium]|nr:hypothetical protein [Spirochaetota bacterium]
MRDHDSLDRFRGGGIGLIEKKENRLIKRFESCEFTLYCFPVARYASRSAVDDMDEKIGMPDLLEC